MNPLSPLVLYSLKTGIALSILYLFYIAFLARLTFYAINRYYLLGYCLLALTVPLLDTTGLWPSEVARYTAPVVALTTYRNKQPAIENTATPLAVSRTFTQERKQPIAPAKEHHPEEHQPIDWPALPEMILLAGMALLFLRLLVQVLSLVRLRRNARPVTSGPFCPGEGERFRLYAMSEPIAPFSVGKDIFIHFPSHAEDDLRRILDHEKAHVRQGHTLDIILCQLLVVFQWWNPLAWLFQRSVRQNLEFLADESVLEKEADPRAYQYLLLKVSGLTAPQLCNGLNFSPLKTRIAMMNKQRSNRLKAARLLLTLPLLVLLLAAFSRRHDKNPTVYHFLGYVADIRSTKPLQGVVLNEQYTGATTRTDQMGYFQLDVPIRQQQGRQPVNVSLTKEGIQMIGSSFCIDMAHPYYTQGSIGLFNMQRDGDTGMDFGALIHPTKPISPAMLDSLADQKDAKLKQYFYDQLFSENQKEIKVCNAFAGNQKIYQVIDGVSFVAFNGVAFNALVGPFTSDLGRVIDTVVVEGKPMTGEEVNQRYTRDQIGNTEAFDREKAMEAFGIDHAVLVAELKRPPYRHIYGGFVVNARTLQPVEGVKVTEQYLGQVTETDAQGYFSLDVSKMRAPFDSVRVHAIFSKEGMKDRVSSFAFRPLGKPGTGMTSTWDTVNLEVNGMTATDDSRGGFSISGSPTKSDVDAMEEKDPKKLDVLYQELVEKIRESRKTH